MTEIVITFVIYFVFILIAVLYSHTYLHNYSDYMLGGRKLSGGLVALGAGASDMSSWLMLALPGTIMVHGFNYIWIPIGLAIGQFFNWQLVAKRLRVYTEIAHDAITIPAYLENRFEDKTKTLRLLTAIIILIFFTFYSASGFVSGGLLFQTVFHISYYLGLFIMAVVVVGYTCLGGFWAVSWIDFFQGFLMLLALLIVPAMTLNALGGWNQTMTILDQHTSPGYLSAFHDVSVIQIISFLGWGLGYFGQPHIIVRFMAMRHHKDKQKAQCICMFWMVMALYGAIFTGIFGRAFFSDKALIDPEAGFIVLSLTLFSPFITGFLLAGVLSAVMSTASSQLLSSSSAIAEDLYRRFLRPKASSKELIWVSRLSVLLIALIALVVAMDPQSSILMLVAHAWAGLGAAFGPVILLSLFWRRMNLHGALAGMLSGALTVIIWPSLIEFGVIFEFYELIPGFIISFSAILIVSLLTSPPSASVRKSFNKMRLSIMD